MGYKSYKLCKAPDARQALNKYQISLGSKMSSVVTIAFLRRKNNDHNRITYIYLGWGLNVLKH